MTVIKVKFKRVRIPRKIKKRLHKINKGCYIKCIKHTPNLSFTNYYYGIYKKQQINKI